MARITGRVHVRLTCPELMDVHWLVSLTSATTMATTETTTLRVPVALRERIAHIAKKQGGTLIDVVTAAVERWERDQWWDGVHAALDGLSDDELAEYRTQAHQLSGTSADGLDRAGLPWRRLWGACGCDSPAPSGSNPRGRRPRRRPYPARPVADMTMAPDARLVSLRGRRRPV